MEQDQRQRIISAGAIVCCHQGVEAGKNPVRRADGLCLRIFGNAV